MIMKKGICASIITSFILFSFLSLCTFCTGFDFGYTVDVDLESGDCCLTFLGTTDWDGVPASHYVNENGDHGVAFYIDNWIFASLPSEDQSCGSLSSLKENALTNYGEEDWNAFKDNISVFFGSYEESALYVHASSCSVSNTGSSSSDIVGITPELEEYLHDIDLAIEEFRLGFAQIEEDKIYEDFQNKEISEKLDVIISLKSLIRSSFDEYVGYFRNEETGVEYIQRISDDLGHLRDNSDMLLSYLVLGTVGENDVTDYSGTLDSKVSSLAEEINKSLVATNENTLRELNATMLTTNSFLSRLYVIFLVILVLLMALIVGWVIHKIINHNLY